MEEEEQQREEMKEEPMTEHDNDSSALSERVSSFINLDESIKSSTTDPVQIVKSEELTFEQMLLNVDNETLTQQVNNIYAINEKITNLTNSSREEEIITLVEKSCDPDVEVITRFAKSPDCYKEKVEEEMEKEEEGEDAKEEIDDEVQYLGTKTVTPQSDISQQTDITNIKKENLTEVGTNQRPNLITLMKPKKRKKATVPLKTHEQKNSQNLIN